MQNTTFSMRNLYFSFFDQVSGKQILQTKKIHVKQLNGILVKSILSFDVDS